MRNLVIAAAIAVAVGLGGAAAWKADAAGAGGAVPHGLSGPMSMPVEPAACNGRTGAYGCGAGYTRRCGPNGRCWCAPC